MRRILVDHARRRHAAKRGGRRTRLLLDEDLVAGVSPNDDILALDEALSKLAKLDAGQAQLVELRFFGGLSVAEAAEALGMSKRAAEREWTMVALGCGASLARATPHECRSLPTGEADFLGRLPVGADVRGRAAGGSVRRRPGVLREVESLLEYHQTGTIAGQSPADAPGSRPSLGCGHPWLNPLPKAVPGWSDFRRARFWRDVIA